MAAYCNLLLSIAVLVCGRTGTRTEFFAGTLYGALWGDLLYRDVCTDGYAEYTLRDRKL